MNDHAEAVYIVDPDSQVASFRYFPNDGRFSAVLLTFGLVLPDTLRCVVTAPAAGSAEVLAWRSPSEAVWICRSSSRFMDVSRALSDLDSGYLVDQTPGRGLIRLRSQSLGLCAHLGSGFAEMALGAVRTGRIGQIAVLMCRPNSEEALLVVDRLHRDYLLQYLDTAVTSALV